VKIGIIEGFFGEPWSWAERAESARFISERGGDFYLYAPKADRRLRREWEQAHAPRDAKSLRDLGAACRQHGVSFGVGLTPFGLHEDWGPDGRLLLQRRLESLARLRIDILAILFDDMPGDFPALAKTQAEIVQVAVDAGVANTVVMCPTYYTDQTILDRMFGQRPERYLQELGERLDTNVGIFWTGPRVRSLSYPSEHLQRVAEEMGRKPFIWDNYPVNDGPRMSRYLYLRAPERPAALHTMLQGLAINPMNQSALSQIPMDAGLRSLAGDGDADLDQATDDAIQRLTPPALAELLRRDWRSFQDEGLDAYGNAEKQSMLDEYAAIEHPMAAQVRRWLRGEYVVSAEILTDV
jgi:hypothetical protein